MIYNTATNNRLSHPIALYHCAYRAVIIFLLTVSTSASAQLFDDEVAREQAVKNSKQLEIQANVIRSVSKKTNELESSVGKIQKNLSSLTQQLQTLNEKIKNLRGLWEEQHEQYKVSEENKTKRDDVSAVQLQKKFLALENSIADINANLENFPGLAIYPSEQELYDNAFAMFQRKEYDKAVHGFRRILKTYPSGEFSANAEYWAALALYNLQKFEDAITAADNIAERHVGSDKVPDARLIVVRALRALEKEDEARQVLTEIVRDYPTSLAADKARQLLAE